MPMVPVHSLPGISYSLPEKTWRWEEFQKTYGKEWNGNHLRDQALATLIYKVDLFSFLPMLLGSLLGTGEEVEALHLVGRSFDCVESLWDLPGISY